MNRKPTFPRWRASLTAALAAAAVHGPSVAADIDIYASGGSGAVSNVMFMLDNTSNWSAKNGWSPDGTWDNCKLLDIETQAKCKKVIEEIFYVDKPTNEKRPWDNGFQTWNASKQPAQGLVELRAIRSVLKLLVCDATEQLPVNVGLSIFAPPKESGTVRSGSDAAPIIHHAVKRLAGTSNSGTCKQLLDKLQRLDDDLRGPGSKTASSADYGAAFYEIFKYYGGYTNPNLAGNDPPTPGTPDSAAGYGRTRFTLRPKTQPTDLEDDDAFTASGNAVYKSPIAANGACGNNYLVLVGNNYPNKEAPGPASFDGLSYTYQVTGALADNNRKADEWSYFLSNTDVNEAPGMQRVFTYAVNVYMPSNNGKLSGTDIAQIRLMQSIAGQGGVGGSGYLEASKDVYKLWVAFQTILLEVASIDSVFTATTLPVSTTTQGTYLNQVFVGMFRPDAQFSPRWVGNLKQYQFGFIGENLELLDSKSNNAVLASSGFFSPTAVSFWTKGSVFFENLQSGTPPSESDAPDGAVVEKGGVAQQLRINNLQNASKRTVLTLPSTPAKNDLLSATPFSTANASVTSVFTTDEINWIRGEANAPVGPGSEDFTGSWSNNGTTTNLGTTGARHSIHGDVLHSRPVAVNYGSDRVIVYYGSNDGFLRAIDGSKTANTGGSELWSFIPPEFYTAPNTMLKRLRNGKEQLQLPETDSAGQVVTPVLDEKAKDYAFDGPIGSYVLYGTGGSVNEAVIYVAMRRGGKSVYAINVKDPSAPTFLWKITSGNSKFEGLAQTWSMAKPIVYKSASGEPPVVVVMGGGYDVAEESNATGNPAGNQVYFINGRDGTFLGSVGTDYSVPADVTVVDLDKNGTPDRAYAVDVRGNVYRIDLPSDKVLDPASWTNTKAVKIAALGGKAFYAVDAVVTRDYVAVLLGTGDREKPLLDTKIPATVAAGDPVGATCASGKRCEGFFLIKDRKTPVSKPVEPTDLALIARVNKASMKVEPVAIDTTLAENGCYMTLAENGEKVVNAPTSIAGVAYFGTNRPAPADPLTCRSGLGDAYAYQFPLFCKTPTNTKLATDGLPPSPVSGVVLIDGKKVPFIIGGGTRGSPFTPEQPKPAVPPRRFRQFWYIDNANR